MKLVVFKRIEDKPRSGRPQKTSDADDRRILILSVKTNQHTTRNNIKNDFNLAVSPSIIRKRINEYGEFRNRWMSRKPFINEKNKKLRALELHERTGGQGTLVRRISFCHSL